MEDQTVKRQTAFSRSDGPPKKANSIDSQWRAMIEAMVAEPGQWFEAECRTNAHVNNIVRQIWRHYRLNAEATTRDGVLYARVKPNQDEEA